MEKDECKAKGMGKSKGEVKGEGKPKVKGTGKGAFLVDGAGVFQGSTRQAPDYRQIDRWYFCNYFTCLIPF